MQPRIWERHPLASGLFAVLAGMWLVVVILPLVRGQGVNSDELISLVPATVVIAVLAIWKVRQDNKRAGSQS